MTIEQTKLEQARKIALDVYREFATTAQMMCALCVKYTKE